MSKNETNSNRKKTSPVLKVIGLLLLLAAVFAGMYLVLTNIKERYSNPEITAVSVTEEQQEEAAVTEEQNDPDAEAQTDPAAEEQTDPTAEENQEAAPVYQAVQPEQEDGSGTAGLRPMEEAVKALQGQDGWFRDDRNVWYSPDGNLCCYNGWMTIGEQSFHFDAAGMLDRGWKTIGGQEFFFDENGVYQPDEVKE